MLVVDERVPKAPAFCRSLRWLTLGVALVCNVTGLSINCHAHEGPDPRANWLFDASYLSDRVLKAQVGPDLIMGSEQHPATEQVGNQSCFRLDSRHAPWIAKGSWETLHNLLPPKLMTVSAWVSLDQTSQYGGIVSAIQDNGDAEAGWVLGYNQKSFYFGLASKGADDGNGKMTYLAGKSDIELGKWYHVCGTFDGETMQLWVNGQLDGESKDQHGEVLYPEEAKLAVGGYLDSNESTPLIGRLRQITIYDLAAKPSWITHDFEHHQQWTSLKAAPNPELPFDFLVKPYLQYATPDSIRVACELTKPGKVSVRFGETSNYTLQSDATSDDKLMHTAILEGLKPETGHYYQVLAEALDGEAQIASQPSSFQTVSLPKTPYAFAVISDPQGNPQVNGKLGEMAWALRPNFLLIPGDLVDNGTVKNQWLNEFFASLNPLISRIPFYPVLGNHEQNADHYYRYMSLPAPEYYYSFRYGNAAFFMIDSNKNVGPGSEQYDWLDKQLTALEKQGPESGVIWRFVCFHHPSYSSDENDYGDLWKGKSTWGDLKIRPLTKLFDKHKIDIVWNGHIHSYERTWPMVDGKVVEKQGTTYMITGGGGGHLEQAGPIRPPFQNNVRHGHHFVYVAINGKTLELKSFDLEGRLFDTVTLTK
jgi:acid phosphatase type 7